MSLTDQCHFYFRHRIKCCWSSEDHFFSNVEVGVVLCIEILKKIVLVIC